MTYIIKKYKFTWLSLLAIYLLSGNAMSQEIDSVISALIYNFAKFTQWQESDQPEKVWKFCYLDEQDSSSLNLISKKLLKGKPIEVIRLQKVSDVVNCQIVYIDDDQRSELPRFMIALQESATLTISGVSGFINMGGMIEIVPNNGRLQFKVNHKRLEQANLKLSSRVLKLAVEIKR